MSRVPDISPSRLSGISYALVAAALWLVLHLHLLPVLLSGLLVYTLINALAPWLQRLLPGTQAHWVLVALLSAAVVGLLSFAIAGGIAYLGSESGNPTILFERMGPVIERARAQLPAFVIDHLPSNAEQIRDAIMAWLSEHAGQLQLAGANAARVIVHLLIGLILGAMLALQMALAQSPGGPLTVVLKKRCENLVIAFHDIVFAQVKISALNTLFTGIFLLVVLPLFGVNLPLAKTLVLVTFICGLLPVLGNLISNTIIFVIGLSVQCPHHRHPDPLTRLGTPDRHAADGSRLRHRRPDRRTDLLRLSQTRAGSESLDLSKFSTDWSFPCAARGKVSTATEGGAFHR